MDESTLTLALSGDVMTGRGIDQILRFPSDPTLHEPFIQDARDYVTLAEEVNGPIPRGVAGSYIWGDALMELERRHSDARIINLETAITTSAAWEAKGINYRMNPRNLDCLLAARIDCCVLSNNHVLDWGEEGLRETLESLRRAGIAFAGAGLNQAEAWRPATLDLDGPGRVLILALGSTSSGIPSAWAAGPRNPGVALLENLSSHSVERVRAAMNTVRKPGDQAIVSIHWGENWGYEWKTQFRIGPRNAETHGPWAKTKLFDTSF